jgi:hypothetical protein
MDEELYALFQYLAQNTKGKSTALNMFDNPFALALAGVYDSDAAAAASQQGAGPLASVFAQSDSPLMQEVLGLVQQGIDQYTLRSFLANPDKVDPQAIADLGYQQADFINMAEALQKEFAESRQNTSQSPFGERGLREPMDEYTAADAPITAEAAPVLAEYQDQAADILSQIEDEQRKADLARKSAIPGTTALIARMLASGEATRQGDYVLTKRDNDLYRIDESTGEMTKMMEGDSTVKRLFSTLKNSFGLPRRLGRGSETEEMIEMAKKYGSGKMTVNKEWAQKNKDYVDKRLTESTRAKIKESELNQDLWKVSKQDEQMRNALLMLAQSQGRTPFKDQAAGFLRFFG